MKKDVYPCCSKYGPQTSSIDNTQELIRNIISMPHLNIQNQNLHFGKSPPSHQNQVIFVHVKFR